MTNKKVKKRIKLSDLQKKAFKGAGCPKCGCKRISVARTDAREYGIARTRICDHCGNSYGTVETRV